MVSGKVNLRSHALWYTLLVGVFVVFGLGFIPQKSQAAAGINQQMNFQGRLLNSQGATVPDGFYNIEFKIYQDGDGQSAGDTSGSPAGALKWTEDHLNNGTQGVTVKNGFLSVQLGSITPFGSNIDWNQDTLWLSINIGNTNATCTPFSSCSGDGEMLPMKRLSTSPYALNSGLLGGLASTQFVQLAQGLQADAGNSVSSIAINKTGTGGNFLNLQASGVDAFTLNNSGNVIFGANANHTISVATAGSGVAGKSLTLTAGTAGTGGSALAGGTLALQGGAGGGTNGNGGNVTLDAGVKNGTGTDGTISIGTTTASAVSIAKTGVTTTINGDLAVASNINTTSGGIQINGSTIIDSSKNIGNVGTISTTGAINSQTISATASFTGTLNVATGYKINGAAATGNFLRGDGTNFVSSTIQAADVPSGSTFYIQNGTSVQTNSNFYTRSAAIGSVAGIIEGANGQTADLLRLNTFNGTTSTTVAKFDVSGNLTSGTVNGQTISAAASFTGTVNAATGFKVNGGAATGAFLRGDGTNFVSSTIQASDVPSGSTYYIQNGTSVQTNANFYTRSAAIGSVGAVIEGASGQTADLLRLNSYNGTSSTVVAKFDQNGNLSAPTGTFTTSTGTSGSVISSTLTNTNATSTAATTNAFAVNLTGTNNSNASANVLNGVNFANVTAATNNAFYGLNFGTGYNDILRYNGTQLVSGTGLLQNAALDNTLNYSNLQKVTNLTATGNLTVQGSSGITVGSTSNIGKASFLDGTNDGFAATLQANGAITASRTIYIPDEDGTICLRNSSNCGFVSGSGSANFVNNTTSVQNAANFYIRSNGNTVTGILEGSNGQNADLLRLNTFNGTTSTTVAKFDISGNLTAGTINGQTISSTASFTGTVNAVTGYKVNGAATSGNFLRGDGTNFVSSTIQAADVPSGSAFYIQNGTSVQTSANFYARSAAIGSVGAVIEGANGQTADLLDLNSYNGTTSSTVAKFTSAGNLNFGAAAHSIAVLAPTTNVAGSSLGISAGDGGSGATGVAGGLLSFAGGNAAGTTGLATGGSVLISGGSGINGGAQGQVSLNGSSVNCGIFGADCLFTTTALGGASGNATFKTSNATSGSSGNITLTSGNNTGGTSGSISIDAGTSSTTAGTISIGTGATSGLTVGRSGAAFTLQGSSTSVIKGTSGTFTTTLGFITPTANRAINLPDAGGTICLQTSSSCGFEATSGTDFIRNQATIQTAANFYIRSNGDTVTGILEGSSGQTADLLRLNTFNGTTSTTVAKFDVSGNLTFNQASTVSSSSGNLTVQAAATLALGNSTSSTVSIQPAGSGTLSLGTTNANTIGIGSTNASTSVAIQGGGGINIGTGNAANTIQIGNTANGIAQIINIGNNATGGSTDTIVVGNLLGSSTTTIQSGTGNINLNVNQAGAGVVVKTLTNNSVSAFQIQNASGSSFFTADSSNKIVTSNALDVGSASSVGAAGRLFSDGFESGSTAFWTGGTTLSGGSTVATDTTTKRDGKYSLKFNVTAGNDLIKTGFKTTTGTIWFRGYFYVSSQATQDLNLMDFYQSNGSAAGVALVRKLSNGHLVLFRPNDGTAYDTGLNFSLNAWHKLEVTSTSGLAVTTTAYLDGQAFTPAGTSNGPTDWGQFDIGDDNSSTSTMYADDVSIDSVQNGDGSSAYIADSLHVAGTSNFAGQVLIQPFSNSTAAFQVQNAAGNSLLNVDTSGANVTVASAGVAGTIQLGNTTGAVAQTINIGNNATSGSTSTVVIGNLLGSSTTTIQAGSGNINLTTNQTGAGTLIKTATNNSTVALQVQNSSSNQVFAVDTSNNQTILGKSSSVNGSLLFKNSAGANGITINSTGANSNYTLTLPSSAPSAGLCLETSNASASQLVFVSCANNNASIQKVAQWDANNTNSVTIAPSSVGNEIVLTTQIPTGGVTVSSVSGGGVTNWTKVVVNAGNGTVNRVEMWVGTVTATGSSAITVTYSSSPGAEEITATEFTAAGVNASTSWGIESSGGLLNSSASATVTFPNLTAINGSELYVGYGQVQNPPATAGSTSGFNYLVTSTQHNVITYNTATSANTAYQPTATQNTSGQSNTVGAILTAFVSSTSINNTTSLQKANFYVQAATSGSVAGVLQAASSGSADIFDVRDGSANNVLTVSSAGNVTLKPATSTTAFQVQNSGGNGVLTVDTSNNRLLLGSANNIAGVLAFSNASNSNTITITAPTSVAASYTLTLPSDTPTAGLCLGTSPSNANQLIFASCATQVSAASISYVNQWSNNGTSITTLADSPASVGNLLVLYAHSTNNVSITGISGGGVTNWTKVTSNVGGAGQGNNEMWRGVVTGTGSATITVTYSAAAGVNEIVSQEFTMGGTGGGTWAVDTSGAAVGSSGTINYPSMTPANSSELYAGYAWGANTMSAGSTSGFTYRVTSGSKYTAANPSVTGGVAVQPTATQSVSGNYNSIAALIQAYAGTSVIVNSTAAQQANFNVQAAASGTVAGVLQGASTGTADILQAKSGSGNNILAVNATNGLTLGTPNAVAGQINFAASGNSNIISIVAPSSPGSSYSLTLPTTTPAAGQCLATSPSNANQLVFSSCANQVTSIAISAVNNWKSSAVTQSATLSVSPTNLGDLMTLFIYASKGNTVNSVSGGGVSVWTKIVGANSEEMWRGIVTSTGSSTVSVSVSTPASPTVELAAQEWTTGSATGSWVIDTSATISNTSSTTVTYPSLTPQSTKDLYVGYAIGTSTMSAGSTSGYTYFAGAGTSIYGAYNNNVSTTSQPTATQASGGTSIAAAALIAAYSSSSVISNSTVTQEANFNIQAATPGSVAGTLQAFTTGSGDALDILDGAGTLTDSFDSTGNFLVKPSTNSASAMQVQTSGGINILSVDTTGKQVVVGAGSTGEASPSLLVLDSETGTTTDPTVVNGGMYYNATTHTFRCGVDGSWQNCSGLLYSNTSNSSANNNCTNNCAAFSTVASIPANYCQPGRVIKLHATGYFSSAATPANLQFGVYYGTSSSTAASDTQIGSLPAAQTVTSANNNYFQLNYNIICFSTSSMQGEGTLALQTGASSAGMPVLPINSTTGTTVVTSSAKNLYIFPIWDTASASNTTTITQYTVNAD